MALFDQTPASEEAPQAQEQQVPATEQPQKPVDETTQQAPEEAVAAVPDVKIRSVADEDVSISVPAGELDLEPGKEYEVSAAFAEQASVLDSVEVV